jgi:HD-GYP domain-containing protein (c-di-GMP phosphodiesterase class II)
VSPTDGRPEVRLAELVALLSLGTDLGLGQPMEHMIRACLIALRLAERLHLDESERTVVYYSGLLAWVGCHTDAYEQAKWLGDDLAVKRDAHYAFDFGRPRDSAIFMLRHIGGEGRPVVERARVGIGFLGDGREALLALAENHYLAADGLAERLGLGDEVRASLRQTYERWDGTGAFKDQGEQILITSRLMNLADVVEVVHRTAGLDAAIAVARERSGSQFDPTLVDLFCQTAPMIFTDLDSATSWDEVIAAEPRLQATVSGDELDASLEAIADFADLKSPWTIGHSRGTADLAVHAAAAYGLPDGDVSTLRRAALVHDIGRLGISNAVWDKRGELTRAEVERVRLHPYLTERMLSFSPALAPLGAVAVQHHERLDGSGYPSGLAGDAISPSGRILGAADAYHALTEMRPHRPARTAAEAAAAMRTEVRVGRLDAVAVDAVLRAAGHRVGRRREWPRGLTAREVEVLRLAARGLSSKEIAEQLVISQKTARNHVQNIYAKLGVSNRAQASLFAVRHGLMTVEGVPERP